MGQSAATHNEHDKRIQSEKSFHNQSFSEGLRAHIDPYYEIFIGIRKHFRQRIIGFIGGKDIVECGCGPSTFAPEFAPHCRSLLGIDISEEAVGQSRALAQSSGLQNAHFAVMNAEALDIPDESVSLLFGSGIIHHLDLRNFYRESTRVLERNGRILFMEPLGHNPLINLYRRFTPKMRTPDEHPLTKKDMRKLKRYFKHLDLKYYYFFTLLAIPFRKMPFFKALVRFLDGVDALMFKLLPFTRYWAWYVLIDASRPRPKS